MSAALCATKACWAFMLILNPGSPDRQVVFDRTPDLEQCRAWAGQERDRYEYPGKIHCVHMTIPEMVESIARGESSPRPKPEKIATPEKINFKGEGEREYQARQRRCLATAIYFEARGESIKGQYAVAQVVLTRVRSTHWPDTICGVVYQGQYRRTGCQFSFTCDGIPDKPKNKAKWIQANYIAKQITSGAAWLTDIGHSTHYHANYVKPRWRHELTKVKQVGTHIFYRVKGEQIRDVI